MKKPKGINKPKKHYAVYWVGEGEGVYAKDYSREYIGETWAVSPAQACNNVRYSLRTKKNPHGGYASHVLGDCYDEGAVYFHFEAEEIKEE